MYSCCFLLAIYFAKNEGILILKLQYVEISERAEKIQSMQKNKQNYQAIQKYNIRVLS